MPAISCVNSGVQLEVQLVSLGRRQGAVWHRRDCAGVGSEGLSPPRGWQEAPAGTSSATLGRDGERKGAVGVLCKWTATCC